MGPRRRRRYRGPSSFSPGHRHLTELAVGGSIAALRAEKAPCICNGAPDSGCVLLSHEERGEDVFQRLRCPCGVTFRRIWMGGIE